MVWFYQFPQISLNYALGDFDSDPVLIGEETGPCVSLCHSYALLGRCSDKTYISILHEYWPLLGLQIISDLGP